MIYAFRFAVGGTEYGTSFQLALACRKRDGTGVIEPRALRKSGMATATISHRTVIDTSDPLTIAILDAYVGVDKIGRGITVVKGETGTRTVDYDATRDPYRASAETTQLQTVEMTR